ncbi:MAG: PEP-CTERM sorting domain-containing protein [Pirellulales bacterium]|nr:PEP-CTERM sorting domain-containing protein [Pirellulales bacterium]
MKVSDLRRKLAATLVASGMLAPTASYAVNLNTNLVVNPGFESVDFGTTGSYGSPLILDWANTGFAFSHDGSGGIPDYANGGEPPNSGSWYFAPGYRNEPINTSPRHHSLATAITQTIDVSTGPSGTLIAGGTAKFNLSAYFSSYGTQIDHGVVQVDFLNAGSTVLGSATVTPGPLNLPDWTQVLNAGSIPVGTASVKVSAWGVLASSGAASDGYMDNLDFQISNALPVLSLNVNRATGSISLINQTGGAENISAYTIGSAFEGLAPANWLSITDNYDNGNPGPNQVDPANAWSEGTTTFADVTESDPSTVGASLAVGRTVNLGNLWTINPNQDLSFSYISDNQPVAGLVNYVGGPATALAPGDFNVDGAITSADWVILRSNQHANLSAASLAQAYRMGDLNGDKANNHADFSMFKSIYDAANGAGTFAAMAAGVPEPSSVILLMAAGLFTLPLVRARRKAPVIILDVRTHI